MKLLAPFIFSLCVAGCGSSSTTTTPASAGYQEAVAIQGSVSGWSVSFQDSGLGRADQNGWHTLVLVDGQFACTTPAEVSDGRNTTQLVLRIHERADALGDHSIGPDFEAKAFKFENGCTELIPDAEWAATAGTLKLRHENAPEDFSADIDLTFARGRIQGYVGTSYCPEGSAVHSGCR
jgi:hypothetical protein